MCADSARKDSFSRLRFHFPGNKPRNRVCNIAEDELARLTDGGANGTFVTAAVRFYNAAVDAVPDSNGNYKDDSYYWWSCTGIRGLLGVGKHTYPFDN